MSSNIKVVAFEPSHLDRIQPKGIYTPGECPKTVMNSAFTLLAGDEVIAILGGFPFIPGVIHFWGLISDAASKRPLDFHKTCLKIIKWYEDYEKPRRMQIDVRVDYPMGQRWAESLGFISEGRMKKWNLDGTDAYLYGRSVWR